MARTAYSTRRDTTTTAITAKMAHSTRTDTGTINCPGRTAQQCIRSKSLKRNEVLRQAEGDGVPRPSGVKPWFQP